jgi:hypothetical protein
MKVMAAVETATEVTATKVTATEAMSRSGAAAAIETTAMTARASLRNMLTSVCDVRFTV